VTLGVVARLRQGMLRESQRALEWLLADEDRARQVAEAVGAVQGTYGRLDGTRRAVLRQLSVPTRSDLRALGKSLAGIRKRVLALDRRLSDASARGSDPRR
jgi:hypothetical protein